MSPLDASRAQTNACVPKLVGRGQKKRQNFEFGTCIQMYDMKRTVSEFGIITWVLTRVRGVQLILEWGEKKKAVRINKTSTAGHYLGQKKKSKLNMPSLSAACPRSRYYL